MSPVPNLRALARVALASAALVACRVHASQSTATAAPHETASAPSDAAPSGTAVALSDAEATAEHSVGSLASLSWLAGTWTTNVPVGPVTVEHWLAPAGGTMLGINRTVFDGRTVFFEYLRIEGTPERITYLASPLGRDPPTRFACIEQGPGVVVFESPDHDYPQRIEYRLQGDELTMTISGTDQGAAKSSQWTMVRAPAH